MKQGNRSSSAGDIELWLAYPDDLLDPDTAESCAAILNVEEQARGHRFLFEKRRREHIATHALKRTAISANFGCAPKSLEFTLNFHGKPAIHPGCEFQFNLSNSDKLVVCLIARGTPVGVDVEACQRAPQILGLASRVFSLVEQAQLHALDQPTQLDRALSLWTLKEAYIKVRGKGLAIPLDGFSFFFDDTDGIRMEIDPSLEDRAERWSFCLFDHADHRIAAMVEGKPAALKILDARPISSPPTPLDASAVVWYPKA